MTLGPGIARTLLPKGFLASGVNCGVRRYRPDIGVILSEVPAVAAGVFTTNQCQAAPVKYCRSVLPADNIVAVITNSGQANAATGTEGEKNNLKMITALAQEMKCDPKQVLVASTGVIGPQLEMDKILPSIPDLLNRVDETAENFALAIMTTDLVPKTVTETIELSRGAVRITGIAKGSGMIHPNMATMLGYILSDVKLTVQQAQKFLKQSVDESFNMISVDGDTSTNDSVFLLANGSSGIALETPEDEARFAKSLELVSQLLAQSIVIDGEGATKLVEVRVTGASDLATARRAARGVTISPLVKTAMHGEDPNWGRIVARLGAEQVSELELSRMVLTMQSCVLFKEGRPADFDRAHVKDLLKKHKIVIEVNLNSGNFSATAWGCDLSKKYVDINTEYST